MKSNNELFTGAKLQLIKAKFELQILKNEVNNNLTCSVRSSNRFGEGTEILVFDNEQYQYSYWCEWDFDKNEYVFEKMHDFDGAEISISLSECSDMRLYSKKSLSDSEYENFAKEKYEQKIREDLAKRILNGEINLTYFCSDTDEYDAPLSKIKEQLIN